MFPKSENFYNVSEISVLSFSEKEKNSKMNNTDSNV